MMDIETFEKAWARFEEAGFNYGEDALEQVRFGWNIAHGYNFHPDGFTPEPKLHVIWDISEMSEVQGMIDRAYNTLEPGR